MISFDNAQSSVELSLAYSDVLLLINYFDRKFWNTFNIKGNEYFFFLKVGAANVLWLCLKVH